MPDIPSPIPDGTPAPPAAPGLTPGIGAYVGGLGLPSQLILSLLRNADVTAFGYRLGDADEVVVPAVDGIATADIVFTAKNVTVTVRAYAGDTVLGTASSDYVISDAPLIGSAQRSWSTGCAGSFWLAPQTAGVASYQIVIGDEPVRELSGDATSVPWTPTAAGDYTVVARSVTTDGTVSDDAYVHVTVS